MPRPRRTSTISSTNASARDVVEDGDEGQEMGSMYDYLAKIILLGPSGSGKSCLLHRFVKREWRILSSQTIGVEFASKIVKVGQPSYGGYSSGGGGAGHDRRKRIKLQLWDTAGTERFRSVSRSYYRGAAGCVLCYDVSDRGSFAELSGFLADVRALASSKCEVLLVGCKGDLADEGEARLAEEQQQQQAMAGSLLDDEFASVSGSYGGGVSGSLNHQPSLANVGLGSRQRATISQAGRAVPQHTASSWAGQNRLAAAMEVSALSGDGVDEVFNKLASTILTKIELGEIDPDDPMSGIQYGDADYYRYEDGGSSAKSGGLTSDGYGGASMRRRRRKGGWGEVFKIGGRPRSRSGSAGGGGKCC